MSEIPFGPFEMMKRMKDVPNILKWSRNKHFLVSGPEFWGTYHIYIDRNLNHYILLPKADLTTHVFIGNPVEAEEWRKYDEDLNLVLSKNMKAPSLEWKIYKDYVLFKGKMLPEKDIPEEPYFGKIIKVEELPEIEITDDWLIEKIKELYDNKNF